MAVGATPSWQHDPAAVATAATQDPDRLPWPPACLLLGGLSAALWSLIIGAIAAFIG